MKRNGNIEFGTTPTYHRPPKPGSKVISYTEKESYENYEIYLKIDRAFELASEETGIPKDTIIKIYNIIDKVMEE